MGPTVPELNRVGVEMVGPNRKPALRSPATRKALAPSLAHGTLNSA